MSVAEVKHENKEEMNEEIFEGIKCAVCQNSDKNLFSIKYRKTNCSIVECQRCSFHFIPPFYRKQIDYTAYKDNSVAEEIKKGDPWLKIQRNLLRYQLIHRYKKQGSVYDVGAGFGHFLLAGKMSGHEVAGIEMSKANLYYIRNELHLPVAEGNFLDVGENKKYDIMTLWDVLEHIDEANRIIVKAAKLVKMGGFLFIQVPQIDSFFARLLKDKWWAMSLDHVNYFSRKTLRQILASHGFEVRGIKSSLELKNFLNYVILPKLRSRKKSSDSWTVAERQREFNKLTQKSRWKLWLVVKVHNVIYKTLSFFHIGDEMIVIAERVDAAKK